MAASENRTLAVTFVSLLPVIVLLLLLLMMMMMMIIIIIVGTETPLDTLIAAEMAPPRAYWRFTTGRQV